MPTQRIDGAPPWIDIAQRYLGTREIPGPRHEPRIQAWLRQLAAWWTDDETPWCGVFLAAVLQDAGIKLPQHWYRARAWLDWGIALSAPAVGCVVVLERGPRYGHVGFVVGRDAADRLLVLGGNQGNAVTIAAFPRSRVLGYRWPSDDSRQLVALPTLGPAPESRSEA